MFEDPLVDDSLEWSDADYDSWVAKLIAADPCPDVDAVPPPGGPAAVELLDESAWLSDADDRARVTELLSAAQRPAGNRLAEVETAPVTAALVAALLDVEPDLVDEDARVALAIGWARVRDAAAARIGTTVASAVRHTTPLERLEAPRLVAAEFGAALALGTGAADLLVDVSIGSRG